MLFNCSVQPHGLCDPMDYSTPALPVHHQLLESTQTHVHRVSDVFQPSHPLLSPSPPASGSFLISGLFISGGQNIGVSASASVLPMNIHKWFPLELTGLIFLQSNGLSRVFSNTTVPFYYIVYFCFFKKFFVWKGKKKKIQFSKM